MLSEKALLAQARRAGVVPSHQRFAHRLSTMDRSRSNSVCAIQMDGRAVVYAKQAGAAARADGDDPISAERRCLDLLRSTGLVPRRLDTGHPDVLWTAALAGSGDLPQLLESSDAEGLARSWGRSLAALHRTEPTSAVPLAPVPWILRSDVPPPHLAVPDDLAVPRPAERSPVARVLAALRHDPPTVDALGRAARTWSRSHWIHGDTTLANTVARRRDEVRWRVWFVDVEGAGLGDPRWDLATAYGSVEYHALRTGTDPRRGLAGLLAGYRDAGGPARLDPDFLAARAALTAVQVATVGPSRRSLDRLLRRALDLAAA